MCTGCRSNGIWGLEALEDSGRSEARINDQSRWSVGGDILDTDSGVVDGRGTWKPEDNGDGRPGDGNGFPGTARGPDVNP